MFDGSIEIATSPKKGPDGLTRVLPAPSFDVGLPDTERKFPGSEIPIQALGLPIVTLIFPPQSHRLRYDNHAGR